MSAYIGDRVAIEPINRYEGYAGFLNSVVEGMRIVNEVDITSLGILVDFFRASIEDSSVPSVLRLSGEELFHIQLADSTRQAPGTGHIDFAEVFRALDSIN